MTVECSNHFAHTQQFLYRTNLTLVETTPSHNDFKGSRILVQYNHGAQPAFSGQSVWLLVVLEVGDGEPRAGQRVVHRVHFAVVEKQSTYWVT